MDLKSVRYMMRMTFMFVIAAMILGSIIDASIFVYIMLGFFAAFIFMFAFLWRCPNCKKHLGKITVHKCKHCGHEIE